MLRRWATCSAICAARSALIPTEHTRLRSGDDGSSSAPSSGGSTASPVASCFGWVRGIGATDISETGIDELGAQRDKEMSIKYSCCDDVP
uniref:Putative secreted protein n=1 Tax=Anopheles triannulatus TaxID=58253 RepID=A0A2M4B351_9DIPT